MLKSVIVTAIVATSLSAQPNKDINSTDISNIKVYISDSIDQLEREQNKTSEWIIEDRQKRPTGESLITKVNTKRYENNQTKTRNSDHNYSRLSGLSLLHDINYSKDSFKSATTLLSIPDDDRLTKKQRVDIDKALKQKAIVAYNQYNLKDHLYVSSLKDINVTIDDVSIATKGIIAKGYYDPNQALKNDNQFDIASVDLTPLRKSLKGEYFKINGFKATTDTKIGSDSLSLNYTISLKLLDANVDKQMSKVEDFHIDMSIANLNLKAYEELEKYGREHTSSDIDDAKLQALSIKLLSHKDVNIEIKDLHIANLISKGENMGSLNIKAKFSLDNKQNVAQLMAISPLMVLSALNADAKIELSKDTMKAIMKDKRAGILMMLSPKVEHNMVVYDVKYTKGKLTINGQKF